MKPYRLAIAFTLLVLAGGLWWSVQTRNPAKSDPFESAAPGAVYSEAISLTDLRRAADSSDASPGRIERMGKLLQQEGDLFADGKRVSVYEVPGFQFPVRVVETRLVQISRSASRIHRAEMAADRLLLRFGKPVDETALQARLASSGYRVARRFGEGQGVEVVLPRDDLHALSDLQAELLGLVRDWDPLYLEPNYIVHTMLSPSDPLYLNGDLWGLHNTGQDGGVADVDINAPEAWDTFRDAPLHIVGIVDSGIRLTHEDLVSNLWINPGEIPGNGIDDDQNGWVDDVHGINVVDPAASPEDDNGHGTHVAGIAGAVGDNGVGVTGVAWETRLAALKFLNEFGSGTVGDAIACVEYATEMGFAVLNCSWGGGSYSVALEESLERAAAAGVLVVTSAGNEAVDTDLVDHYPSGYALGNVLSVASVGRSGELSAFSNYGLETVDIAAPGSNIVSTYNDSDEDYAILSGTSMAAPHVSAALALLMTSYPDDSPYEQLDRVVYSSRVLAGLSGRVASEGMLDLRGALNLLDPPSPPRVLARPDERIVLKEGYELLLELELQSESQVTVSWTLDQEAIPVQGETLRIEEVTVADAGRYEARISNSDGFKVVAVEVEVAREIASLAESVEWGLGELYSYGEADWGTYPFDGVVGSTSARSGDIEDGGQTSLFAEIQGPGTLVYHWRLSAEPRYDYGFLIVDGVVEDIFLESGEWLEATVELEEEKLYRLEWVYQKDGSISEGQDALFLDNLRYFVSGDSPPLIVDSPKDMVLAPGASGAFEVTALGDDLSYQWYREAEILVGEVSHMLVIEQAHPSMAGAYQAVVSNGNGETWSESATLEVAEVPVAILSHPEGQSVDAGEEVRFSVEVSGALPISYQWLFEGMPITGATDAQLRLPQVAENDAGNYSVVVENDFSESALVSEVARLEVGAVRLGPRIVKQPRGTVLKEGSPFDLSVVAEGSFPLVFQWSKDGQPIEGQTGSLLAFTELSASDSGSYSVEVSNSEGATKSETVTIEVLAGLETALGLDDVEWRVEGDAYFYAQSEVVAEPGTALQSSTGTASDLNQARLIATVEGPVNLAWFWKQESYLEQQEAVFLVDGEVQASLVGQKDWIHSFAPVGEGFHEVEFRYLFRKGTTLWLDRLERLPQPVIYENPQAVAVEVGQQVEFSVSAFGAGDLTYRWFKDGEEIEGETGSEIRFDAVALDDGAEFTVEVSSGFGTTVSTAAKLSVVESLSLSVGQGIDSYSFVGTDSWHLFEEAAGGFALRSGSVEAGGESLLEVVVEGPGRLAFDWRLEGEGCCPYLELSIAGERVWEGSIYESYERKVFEIPAGETTVRWRFVSSARSVAGQQSAFLRNLLFTDDLLLETQPRDVMVIEGQTAKFSVSVLGDPPYSFQWYKGESVLVGQNAQTLELMDVGADDEGLYSCRASDALGREVESASAELEVLVGFYEAVGLDRLSSEFLRSGNDPWRPVPLEGQEGSTALLLEVPSKDTYNQLQLRTSDPSGERRAFSFRMKVEGMTSDARVSVSENLKKEIVLRGDAEWRNYVLPVSETGENLFVWRCYQGIGSGAGPMRVWLDDFRWIDEPVLYEGPRSAAVHWGANWQHGVDVVGDPPFSYEWSRTGIGDSIPTESANLEEIGIVLGDTGKRTVTVSNEWGQVKSEPFLLAILNDSWGRSVGLGSAAAFSSGDVFWEVSERDSTVGNSSLSAGGLGSQEVSELSWPVQGPGILRFDWKLDSPGFQDRLLLYADEFLVAGLFEPTDWREFEVEIDDAAYEFRLRLESAADGSLPAGRAWLDAVRFEPEGALSYEDWALERFAEEAGSGISGWEYDADEDGLPNFSEYALGLDPLRVDPFPRPEFERDIEGGARIRYLHALQNETEGVAVGLEFSRDSRNWYPVVAEKETLEVEGEFYSEIYYLLGEKDLKRELFVRLAVYYLPAEP